MPNRDIGDQRRIAPDVSIVGLDDRPFAAPYRSLTARRAKITPERAGLPVAGQRRVPGYGAARSPPWPA